MLLQNNCQMNKPVGSDRKYFAGIFGLFNQGGVYQVTYDMQLTTNNI